METVQQITQQSESDFTQEELNLLDRLKLEGYYCFRKIPNKGICALRKFIFTTGLIIGLDEDTFFGRYCYSQESEALSSLLSWNGLNDPDGNWLKYKGRGGERENNNGGCSNCKLN